MKAIPKVDKVTATVTAPPSKSYSVRALLLGGLEHLALDGLRPAPRHPTHFVIDEAVACAQKIGAKQTWLIHLTHEVDHATVEAGLPAGVRLAYDGLRLELNEEC